MTALLVAEDFTEAAASLSNPPWGVGASQFVRESGRAYGAVAPGSTALAIASAFDPGTILSASTPKVVRYELDVRLPDTLPASGEVKVGLGALMRSSGRDGLHLVYRRTSGGASALVELLVARPTGSALSDVSLYSAFAPGSFTALAAGVTARLRLDVQLNATNIVATAYLDGVLMFVSTPTLASFNLATGRSLSAFTAATCYPALIVLASGVAGSSGLPNEGHRTYVDRLRVLDAGSLAELGRLDEPPTPVADPTRTPITPDAEDEGTVAELEVHPSYPIAWSHGWLVDEHPYDGGYVATVARQTRRRRSAPFQWDALSSTQKDDLEALWEAVEGRNLTFSWTDPETGETFRLGFASQLRIVQVAPAVWQADADVEERFADA